jgi:hypothetical protein
MLQYLIFLLLLFIIIIYGYIYIKYKYQKKKISYELDKQKNIERKAKLAKLNKPIKLQKSLDQLSNGVKYPSINYKWNGCPINTYNLDNETNPTTNAIDPREWY